MTMCIVFVKKKKKLKKPKKKKIEQLMKTMYSPLVGKWVNGRTAVCQREEFMSIGKLAEACHEGRIKSRDRTGQARSSDWPGRTKKRLFYFGVIWLSYG